MDYLSTIKALKENLNEMTEKFDISPMKKEKKQNSEVEESPFSFSFSNFSTNEVSKVKEHQKYKSGLNLLVAIKNKFLEFGFEMLQRPNVISSRACKIMSLFNIKKKRAAFIKWYVQSIKLSSDIKIPSAMLAETQPNSFSRKFILCSLLFNLFDKKFIQFGQKFFIILLTLSEKFQKSIDFHDTSLIPIQTRERWYATGLIELGNFIEKRQLLSKIQVFRALNDDISLQRKAFIQNTDRCIALSEQLFEAKEAKEKAEFEKEELAAVLDSKTDELNKLMDMIEEYKTWQNKLSALEKTLNDEILYWKSQANKIQSELEKKNKEIIDVYSDKKKAEEECLKAYRNLDVAQRQNVEIQKQLVEKEPSPTKSCNKCESYQAELKTYDELIEEFKKNEEKLLEQIKELQEQVSRPPSTLASKSKLKPQKKPVKKTLEFDKQSISENETQLAVEIVNLNKQVSKLKHESKVTSELLKKCQQERDELKKLMIGKDEALTRLRKENDQLSLSLSTDHYKSVHKLEQNSSVFEHKNKELMQENANCMKIIEELKETASGMRTENESLKNEIAELKESQKTSDTQKLMETFTNLQNQFYRLKDMSDRQIQTIESLKQDNYQLMQNIESLKAYARSSKLHADKASSDAEAYASVIKKMEAEMVQTTHQKELAESEAATLKQHLMKILNSR